MKLVTVTAWITVTDIDETGDTMTVGGSSAGKITVTIGLTTCFTAGGLAAYDAAGHLQKKKDHFQKLS